MALALTTTFGLAVWIVLWSIGARPLDAFLVTTLIMTFGATAKILRPYLPGRE
jgi:hypothetical protein